MKTFLPLLLIILLPLCGCTQAKAPATQAQIDEITDWYEQLIEDNNILQKTVTDNANAENDLVLRCQAFSTRLAALGNRFSDSNKLYYKAYCNSIKNEESELCEELEELRKDVQQLQFEKSQKNLPEKAEP